MHLGQKGNCLARFPFPFWASLVLLVETPSVEDYPRVGLVSMTTVLAWVQVC